MKQSGFTLIEVIVVMVVMGILLSIATLGFNDWMRKAQIEKQTRELFMDLNTARSESVFLKRRHAIKFNSAANGYVFKRYSSENEAAASSATEVFSKTTSRLFSKQDGSSVADDSILFTTRGYTSDSLTVRVNPVNSGAAFDCVIVSPSRINIGKMEGNACEQK